MLERPIRVLSVLGQRPSMTGSGTVVAGLFKAGTAAGDDHRLICAGYAGDEWSSDFGSAYEIVTCTGPGSGSGELSFPVPGMSDVMPYLSSRYSDLTAADLDAFVAAFRARLDRAVAAFKPDVLHLHHLWALTGLSAATALPCVVTVHGTDLQQAKLAPQHRWRVAANLPHLSHVFCVSRDMAMDATAEYNLPAAKVSVVGNGYDETLFTVAGPARKRDRKLVLCVGKFVAWKGFDYAIQASARVGVPHDLVILGDGPPAQRELLEKRAAELGAAVHLPGHLDPGEVATWMRSAEVFLLPSVHEPFGIALLEAMACGTRIVSSDSGGPRDIITPDLVQSGLATLVPALNQSAPGDEERYIAGLAAGMQFQLSQPVSPAHRDAVAASVAERSWNATYAAIRDTYLSLLEDR